MKAPGATEIGDDAVPPRPTGEPEAAGPQTAASGPHSMTRLRAPAVARRFAHTRAGQSARTVASLVAETFREWSADQAPRLGAALSYYTIFSLAPVLVVVIAVAGFFLGPEAAQGRLTAQLNDLFGHE